MKELLSNISAGGGPRPAEKLASVASVRVTADDEKESKDKDDNDDGEEDEGLVRSFPVM